MGKTVRRGNRKGEQKAEPYKKPKTKFDTLKGITSRDAEELFKDEDDDNE